MVNYKILFKKSAKKELEEMSTPDLQRIVKKISLLHGNPRPHGVEKISGHDKYQLRQGDYRIVYSIQDDSHEVWIYKIAHRKLVYKKM
jgi:mRNA interferase RelE/StbE